MSFECARAAAERRLEKRSGPSPCWLRSALILARTPCSRVRIAVAGRSAVAPAGDATNQRPQTDATSAKRRTARLAMQVASADRRGRRSLERARKPESGGARGSRPAAMPQPVQEDDLERPRDRD